MYLRQFLRRYSINEQNKVKELFDAIINLKLFEAQELSEKLRTEFKINNEILFSNQDSRQKQNQDTNIIQEELKKEIKTEFNVILQKIDPNNKAKIIKEIKSLLPNLNLVEAKNFVESVPKLIRDKVKSEEAKAIKTTLENLGAQISLE